MAMLVKNIADHFRPRIQEHVISKRRRPIGNREPRALAGDEAADKEERKGRAGKDYREPMGPQPPFTKEGERGIRNLRIQSDTGWPNAVEPRLRRRDFCPAPTNLP